jgi:hypothetical protein
MHPSKSIRLLACISVLGAALVSAGSAWARPEIPGKLQEAAGMSCVPLCTMCHLTNPGQADNWTMKTLSGVLVGPIQAETDIKPAYDMWAATNPTLAEGVRRGYEPGSLAPGKTPENVCGPVYGCAIPAAKPIKSSSPDYTGVIWVVGAVAVGAVLRRRKKAG